MVKRTVEAALFTAGKPVSVSMLSTIAGSSKGETREALEELVEEYDERDSAVEVREAGKGKFIMQVRPEFAEDVMGLAPRELSRPLLRTLSVIAYRQPVTQSEVVELRGNTAYGHVEELVELGMVDTEPHGRTKLLTTTSDFAEYFGISGEEPDDVRRALEEKSDRGLFEEFA